MGHQTTLPLFAVLLSSLLLQLSPPPVSASDESSCQLLPSVDEVVTLLDLDAADDGWRREIFRSTIRVDAPYGSNRSALVSSYYLMQNGLSWRRNEFDETWSYYTGSDAVEIFELKEDDGGDDPLTVTMLGSRVLEGEVAQHTIEADTWYAAKLNKTDDDQASSYALIGTQSGPGMKSTDWIEGNATDLQTLFPSVDADTIMKLSMMTAGETTRPTTRPRANACTFPSVEKLIDLYELQKHPEGGFFVETFRSSMEVNSSLGSRDAMTSIYYAMFAGNHADFHRLRADETWNHYLGESIHMYFLVDSVGGGDSDGTNLRTIVLGNNLSAGEIPEFTIKAGTWFGAALNPSTRNKPGAYSLFGANVGPGFEYEDWELGSATELIREFPGAASIIMELTPKMDESTAPPTGDLANEGSSDGSKRHCGGDFCFLMIAVLLVLGCY